jgi:hypothetical protein
MRKGEQGVLTAGRRASFGRVVFAAAAGMLVAIFFGKG